MKNETTIELWLDGERVEVEHIQIEMFPHTTIVKPKKNGMIESYKVVRDKYIVTAKTK